jgi:dihydrofolate reductase
MSHSSTTHPAAAPRIYLVAAVAANGIIGARGKLPWHLPEDLKFFKGLTMGKPIIMGRRTWESIGRPLPGRRNIVVTRRSDYRPEGAEVASSLEQALEKCAGETVAYVIGGADLFAASLPLADGLVLTEIHRDYEGDVRFPDWDRSDWREAKRQPHQAADGLGFDFVLYERAR